MSNPMLSVFGPCNISIPTEQELISWSLKASFGRSLNKVIINDDVISVVIKDLVAYNGLAQSSVTLQEYSYRVKTADSILRKIDRKSTNNAKSVFNDLLGIRVRVKEYPVTFSDIFRVVDLRDGKAVNDGYRAVHLYYTVDNTYYPIEIQLWSDRDSVFNGWMHGNGYKVVPPEFLLWLKQRFDRGMLSFEEYNLEVSRYVQ